MEVDPVETGPFSFSARAAHHPRPWHGASCCRHRSQPLKPNCCTWKDVYIIYICINLYICICVHVYIRHASTGLRRDVLASKFNIQTYLYICIYVYSHHGVPCYLQRARASMRVRSQAILLSYMLHGPPSPNQHIGGRSSAHRMCVGRDDLASSFAIDVPFETDFLRQCIRLRTRPHATDRPTKLCA